MATNLVSYGIHEESSDVRVHVCPVVRRLYVFRTADARKAIEAQGHTRSAYQQVNGVRVLTATGYAVPWHRIVNCIQVPLRDHLWEQHPFKVGLSETAKGRTAERLVRSALRLGVLPLPVNAESAESWDEQLSGIDIVIPVTTIQVKCDYRGGAAELGGTGNLFIQIAEINPKRLA